MDSRLKAQVIACVTVIVLMVITVVFILNYRDTGFTGAASQTVQTGELSVAEESALAKQYQLNPSKDPYAFLQDEDFFDKEKEEVDQSRVLSLLVTTVQKDIRVNVVDGAGKLVTGQAFEVTLKKDGEPLQLADAPGEASQEATEKAEQTGEQPKDKSTGQNGAAYKDDDRDGMIYISELAAGNYEVGLKPVTGYTVPQSELTVNVSEDISYTVLDDISFLIRSEDEIDASKEDTAVNEAEADADGTESNKRLEDGASVFGIDVSKWNREIDWTKVKNAGVEFAIIRCGYRGSSTGALVEDPYFAKNIKGATDAGIRVGVYFFTQAVTPIEAVEEASMVLMLCREYKISYPLYIDTEGAGGNGRADGLDKETRTAVCRAFCETIENSGFTAGVYASKSWLNNNLEMNELDQYTVWLAQYSSRASYDGDYGMWQYTSAGTIDGIGTLVDFNASYMDY